MKWREVTTDVTIPTHQFGNTSFIVEFHVLDKREKQWKSYFGDEVIAEVQSEIQAKVACENLLEKRRKDFAWKVAYNTF